MYEMWGWDGPEYSRLWLLAAWPLPLWEERRAGARPCLRSRPLSNGFRQTPDKAIILVIGGVKSSWGIRLNWLKAIWKCESRMDHLHDKLVLRGLQSEKEFLFPARVQRPLLGLRQDRVHHLVPPSVKKQAIKYMKEIPHRPWLWPDQFVHRGRWPQRCLSWPGCPPRSPDLQTVFKLRSKIWSTLSLRILVLSLLPEGGRYPTIRGSDIIKTQWQLDQNPWARKLRKRVEEKLSLHLPPWPL